MTGFPAAFEPSAFQNDAFQTGGITPVTPTQTPFGGSSKGKKKRKRYFTYNDGRTVEIESDYQLSQIVNELMQARVAKQIERRAKGKQSRKIRRAMVQPKPIPQIDPMILYQMLEVMADTALTQANILNMLDEYQRMQAEDEDITLILLSL